MGNNDNPTTWAKSLRISGSDRILSNLISHTDTTVTQDVFASPDYGCLYAQQECVVSGKRSAHIAT